MKSGINPATVFEETSFMTRFLIVWLLPLIERAKSIFKNLYGDEATIITSAPGRLNFGGEHCDYMGGYVLPFPTTLVGVVAGRPVPGKVICTKPIFCSAAVCTRNPIRR